MTPAFLMRLRTVLLWVMLGAMATTVGILILWILGESTFGEMWLVVAMMVGGYSFTAMLCVNMLCRSRYKGLMWAGVASSAIGFVAWQPALASEVWRLGFDEQLIAVVGTCFTIIAAWSALFAALKSHSWTNTLSHVMIHITLSIAAFVGAMIFLAVLIEPRDETYFAVLGVASLLGGCSLLASMSLAMMTRVRSQGSGETMSGKVVVNYICPRCKVSQVTRTGLSRCTNCGLRVEITVEEPVCVCGYQLYQLTTDTCPECGRTISEQDRWIESAPPPTDASVS